MSTSADLVAVLKRELKSAQMTYADLALALGMAESSVKRMLSKGDMPLSRIDEICRALKLDFAELAKRVADMQPLVTGLTEAQEKAVVADKKLLLVAICVLSQWTLEQITASYRLSQAECIKYLVLSEYWLRSVLQDRWWLQVRLRMLVTHPRWEQSEITTMLQSLYSRGRLLSDFR